jgi:hypothetical protein
MRKILIILATLLLCVVAAVTGWILCGRQLSSFIDRYWTVESRSLPIQSIEYEGSGTGGILIINYVRLSLNDVRPNVSLSIGSTKNNELALATSGKVFPFGPLTSTSENDVDHLATSLPSGDQAFLAIRRGFSWPTPLDLNFMSGQSPSWKRNIYQEIQWKKSSGAKLQMLWRYEQFFYPAMGWTSGLMTREGSTGLIRVEVKE